MLSEFEKADKDMSKINADMKSFAIIS